MSRFAPPVAVFLLVPFCTPAPAQELKSSLTLDKQDVRLSETIRATLTIEGPAPLRVTVPKNLLADESAGAWKAQVFEPAKVAPIESKRQRWTLVVRLDPYVRGESLKLAFVPFEAVAGSDPTPRSIAWPGQTVRVWTAATMADDVRPVTGIEPTPPAPARAESWTGPSVALAVVGLAGGAVGLARYRRRRHPPSTPLERVEKSLNEDSTATAVADAVRRYVEATFAVPATRLTTAELALQIGALPDGAGTELVNLLEQCDAAKFAGRPAAANEIADRARRFLALARSPARG